MNETKWILCAGLLSCMFAPTAKAHDGAKLLWQTDVQDAWRQTQQQGRPLLVFVTRDDCFYCTQMKDKTYRDVAVSGAIRAGFVPLVLDGTTASPLLKELGVTVFPSTFVISPQAVVMDRIDGYVTPQVLSSRLLAVRSPVRSSVAKLAKDP